MTKALEDIAAERQRQIEQEGWTPEHDDANTTGALAMAAAAYNAMRFDRINTTPTWVGGNSLAEDAARNTALIVEELYFRALAATKAEGHAEGVAQEREQAAQIGYVTCASTRHVTLGQQVRDNILAGALPDQSRDATNPFAPMDNHGWLDAATIRKGDSHE